MFIKNKYTKTYYSIITRAKSRSSLTCYTEKHHIIPKSLGGSNNSENLVCLTAKEHFICHLLLPKMTVGDQKRKMVYAAWRMSVQGKPNQDRYQVSSKIYEMIKTQRSAYLKTLVGPLSPNFGNKTGRTSDDFTPEWRSKISASRKGKSSWNKGVSRTEEEKSKISITRKIRAKDPIWNLRPACSIEKAQKIRLANLNKKKLYNPTTGKRATINLDQVNIYLDNGWVLGQGPRKPVTKKECPHCGKLLDPGNFSKFHGNNCKSK
jgi:hypothetical protein